MSVKRLKNELKSSADLEKAIFYPRFFKTGPGEYGEGDVFLGVTVPNVRKLIKNYKMLTLDEIKELLKSKIHEHRLAALLILVSQFTQACKSKDHEQQKKIYLFYIQHFAHINNWDLVDQSSYHIVGKYLYSCPEKEWDVLYKWGASDHLWSRRIAIVSTLEFIRNNHLATTYNLSLELINDPHDLIHKACGWMLREAGKRDMDQLELFILKHGSKMPRTMLRYAIEKFPEKKRKKLLQNKI
jgi:3-methyladenine DNA glycosylase AlkD